MTDREITSELFENLLDWLGPTRDEAATKYEAIRDRLIKIFLKKGCTEPEELTDDTIERVTRSLPKIKESYEGNPLWYFISIARRVWWEWLRSRSREVQYDLVPEVVVVDPQRDPARECLQQCLRALSQTQRDLVLDYHLNKKRAKIDLHKTMADELGLSPNALRLRTHRIRMGLEKCVMECLNAAAK
jgi:DNA-directed RNA polymerase specialized sigma24 family protein